jgi:hypothetical protein
LFLDYWTTGVRNAVIRQRIRVVLEEYRAAFREVAAAVVAADASTAAGTTAPATPTAVATAEGVASVAVSLIHGCALQSVIDPKGFDVRQHFDAAAQMLDRLSNARLTATAA